MMMNSTTIHNQAHHRGHRGTQRIKPPLFSLFTLRASAFSAIKTVLVIMLLSLAISAQTTRAEDYSKNIGFMKNPPKELKEKFPMCDQFLDVKWIRQFPNGGWVGTVTADVYLGDKKEQRELVVMQEQRMLGGGCVPELLDIIDLSKTNYRGNLLEELIISSDNVFSYYATTSNLTEGFAAKKAGKLTAISKEMGRSTAFLVKGFPWRSLTYFTQNVCVSLPTIKAAWIVENTRPFLIKARISAANKLKFEQLRELIAKDCNVVTEELRSYGRIRGINSFCTDFASREEIVSQRIFIQDFDGDGVEDYKFVDYPVIAFINDKKPFLMPYPKNCNSRIFYARSTASTEQRNVYYHPVEMKKEEACIAEEKKRYLLDIKNQK